MENHFKKNLKIQVEITQLKYMSKMFLLRLVDLDFKNINLNCPLFFFHSFFNIHGFWWHFLTNLVFV
jgi:hypothetical protein